MNYNLLIGTCFELNWRVEVPPDLPKDIVGTFPFRVIGGGEFQREKFWRSMRKYVENFKLRASYGALGNNKVGLYATKEIYNSANTAFGDKVQQE